MRASMSLTRARPVLVRIDIWTVLLGRNPEVGPAWRPNSDCQSGDPGSGKNFRLAWLGSLSR